MPLLCVLSEGPVPDKAGLSISMECPPVMSLPPGLDTFEGRCVIATWYWLMQIWVCEVVLSYCSYLVMELISSRNVGLGLLVKGLVSVVACQ